MERLKSIFWFILVGIIFSSCTHFSDITVGDIRSFSLKGFEENYVVFSMNLPVDNPTAHKVTITDLEAKVYLNGSYLGKVNLSEPLVIEKKATKNYDMVLKVRMANLLGSAFTMMSLKQGQKVHIKADGYFSARSMLLKKKIKIDEDRRVTL